MVSLDKLAEKDGIQIVGAERLPKGASTVENVGRLINAARALEKAAAADRENFIRQECEMKDKLLAKEEEINDLRKIVAELTYENDGFKRRQAAEQLGLSIAQRKRLGVTIDDDEEVSVAS